MFTDRPRIGSPDFTNERAGDAWDILILKNVHLSFRCHWAPALYLAVLGKKALPAEHLGQTRHSYFFPPPPVACPVTGWSWGPVYLTSFGKSPSCSLYPIQSGCVFTLTGPASTTWTCGAVLTVVLATSVTIHPMAAAWSRVTQTFLGKIWQVHLCSVSHSPSLCPKPLPTPAVAKPHQAQDSADIR